MCLYVDFPNVIWVVDDFEDVPLQISSPNFELGKTFDNESERNSRENLGILFHSGLG